MSSRRPRLRLKPGPSRKPNDPLTRHLWRGSVPAVVTVKVSFPGESYTRFMERSRKLGYQKRGERWKLLDLLFAYAEAHFDLFRKR